MGDGLVVRVAGLPAPVVDLDLEAGAFRSRGCGTWSDALTPVAMPGQPFGDGWLVVGVDIAPGRYRTAATTECVWERLEGFRGWYRVSDRRSFELPRRPDGNGVLLSGTPSDDDLPIGTSEYAGQPEPRWESFLAVVDIAPADAGFRSEGCGVWSSDLAPRASPGQPFGEGTFLVGPEVAPGRYRAESPTALCRWQRWKRFGGWPYSQYDYGDFDELVGGLAGVLWHDVPLGQAIVDIAPSDAGFHSEGCGVWTNDLSPPPAPARSFGDGTLRVGVDIAPGRYRSLSPHECEWARLSAFGGSSGDVIAAGAVAIVDIAPSDAGFHGAGCGVWTNDLSPASAPGQPFGGGALFVGAEIAPGRYYAHPDPAASESRQCRWQRLREGEGGLERAGGGSAWRTRAAIDIATTDAAFHSENCGVWSADPAPSVAPGQPFGAAVPTATWLVGIEVAPGRYRAYPGGNCEWRRLRGFGGTDGDTIAGGGVRQAFWTGAFYLRETEEPYDLATGITVEIAPADAGFHTSACGAWTPAA